MKKIITLLIFFNFLHISSQEKWTVQSVEDFQTKLNKQFADKEKSPLPKEDLEHFKALNFYPINEKYAVEAELARFDRDTVLKMKTSTDRLAEYRIYGELHFVLENRTFKLYVYQNVVYSRLEEFKNDLFLPFTDMSYCVDSYIGGRYIDLKIPKGNKLILDFNKSFNPYCAYNHIYSCPIPPKENDLDIEILAGVKKYHD